MKTEEELVEILKYACLNVKKGRGGETEDD